MKLFYKIKNKLNTWLDNELIKAKDNYFERELNDLKHQEQQVNSVLYKTPSQVLIYHKIKITIDSCETMQQLINVRNWMREIHYIYNLFNTLYYKDLHTAFNKKWNELL